MSNRGGYQKPNHPAPTSGPGALSRRTDGGPGQPVRAITGGPYGSSQAFQAMEQAAPMAGQAPTPSPGKTPPPQGAAMPVIPFGAPTQNPDEPVTAGAAMGPGVGPDALGLQDQQTQIDRQDAQRMAAYLPALEQMANQPGSSAAIKAYVRQIKVMAV
jgi:hypothetical protein